jgi:hypothetical protein
MAYQNIYRPSYCYSMAVGTASAQSPRAIPIGVHAVRLKSSIDCWVSIDGGATAVVGSAIPLNAMETEYFLVCPGQVIAVIDNDGTSTGNLSIVEMTR